MPAVSGSPTQEATTLPDTGALESVEVSQFGDGDLALVQAGDVFYVLDVESIAVRNPAAGVLWTRNSNPSFTPTATALTPGRWIRMNNTIGCSCPTGPTGPAGGLGAGVYGNFFQLITGGGVAATGAGQAMTFASNGPASGITRLGGVSTTEFVLPNPGVYQINWQASVTEAGQMVVGMNGTSGTTELPETTVGRATGSDQIVGDTLITTTLPNSVLTIRNPASGTTSLTRTPDAGSGGPVSPVSSTLTIKQIL